MMLFFLCLISSFLLDDVSAWSRRSSGLIASSGSSVLFPYVLGQVVLFMDLSSRVFARLLSSGASPLGLSGAPLE